MAARDGTRSRYNGCCRCDDCVAANSSYHAEYRQRRMAGSSVAEVPVRNLTPAASGPGPVESAVKDEIGGLAAEARPGLAQAALAMARILDNPKAVNQQPHAAKVLAALLEKLHSTSARGRRGGLSLVRDMTTKDGV